MPDLGIAALVHRDCAYITGLVPDWYRTNQTAFSSRPHAAAKMHASLLTDLDVTSI